MVDVSNTKVQYWTQRITNLTGSNILPIAEQLFTYPLLAKSDDYVMAVERFEVSLNAVPFYVGQATDTINVYQTSDDSLINSALIGETQYFSFFSLISAINSVINSRSNSAGWGTSSELTFDGDGRVILSFANWATYYFVWPDGITNVTGIASGKGATTAYTTTSQTPRFDIADECQGVVITSNLGVFSDTTGQAKANVLTDLSFAQDFSVSVDTTAANDLDTITYQPRGRLIYTPAARRFLNFASPIPLYDIKIQALYISIDQTVKEFYIPVGGVFDIKIGFYKKNANT